MKVQMLILLLLQGLFACSQNKTGDFTGTWHHQNGNEIFVVSLWPEGNDLIGHVKMIIVDNQGVPIETIYNSKRLYGQGSNLEWPPAIHPTVYQNTANGIIADNTSPLSPYSCLTGNVKMVISQTTPLTIQWSINRIGGIKPADEADFNFPTDITLIKVSNTVNP